MSPTLTYAVKRLNYYCSVIDDAVGQHPFTLHLDKKYASYWVFNEPNEVFLKQRVALPSNAELRDTILEAARQTERTIVVYTMLTSINRVGAGQLDLISGQNAADLWSALECKNNLSQLTSKTSTSLEEG